MHDSQDTTSEVVYRDHPSYPRYRIGSDGTVWRVMGDAWFQLEGAPDDDGYIRVSVIGTNGKRVTRSVHVLVLESFIGFRRFGQETRHLDSNPSNNRLENLRWGTPLQNGEDRRKRVALGIPSYREIQEAQKPPEKAPRPGRPEVFPPRLRKKHNAKEARCYYQNRYYYCGTWDETTDQPSSEALVKWAQLVTAWAAERQLVEAK